MDLPSQTDHDCIMEYEDDNWKLDFYFMDMLNAVDENAILQSWEDIVRISHIPDNIIDLHKMVLTNKDYLDCMKTEVWIMKMKRMVLTISRIEDRLFHSSF